MVPPVSHKVSRVSWYSGAIRVSLVFAYATITLFGLSFPAAHSANKINRYDGPQPQSTEVDWFGLFRVRSPLLTESRLISFPDAT